MTQEAAGIHEEEALGKAYDAHLMRRLLRYLRPYHGPVAIAVVALLGGAALELVGPWLMKVAIDRAVPQRDTHFLLLLTGGYVAALVVAFVLEYAQTLLTTWLGQRVMFDLRREVFAHLQRLHLAYFDRNPVGRLMTRVTNDVEVLNELFSSGVVTVFGDLFTLVFIIAAMLWMNWRLALVTFAVLPLVVLTAFYFRNRIRDAFREIRVRLARINAFLQERISGVVVVQLFGQEEETNRRFRAIDSEWLQAHLRSITYYALFFPVIEFLTAIALALILAYGGVEAIGGGITVGVIAAFLYWARRFFRPIQDLSEKYNMLQGAMASSERIFRLLDTEPAIRPPAAPTPPAEPGRGAIEFRGVWFAYQRRAAEAGGGTGPDRSDGAGPDRIGGAVTDRIGGAVTDRIGAPGSPDGEWDWVLRDIDFTVRPGERIAIVGHTGAGKTSLINLLMRFYAPQKGEILFDGVPIERLDPEVLRRRIGLVLQDVFIFTSSVGYNIRLGRDDIPEERLREAARRVGAERFIERLPRGFDEPLGERGASLSVGERQLLSFARALAFDPLVLVLDEATSSVDSALEARIEEALETLMRGRTSLVIAHRLSTVQSADRILVLHHGVLREQGTHQELLRRGGLYARLYELQFAQPAAAAG